MIEPCLCESNGRLCSNSLPTSILKDLSLFSHYNLAIELKVVSIYIYKYCRSKILRKYLHRTTNAFISRCMRKGRIRKLGQRVPSV